MGIINQENNLNEEIKKQNKLISRLKRILKRRQNQLQHDKKMYYIQIKKLRESGQNEEERSLAKTALFNDKMILKLDQLINQANNISNKISSSSSFYELSTILTNSETLFDNKLPIEKIKELIEIISTDACNKEIHDNLIDEIIYIIFGDLEKEIKDEDINILLEQQFFSLTNKGFDPPLKEDNKLVK